MTVVAGGSRSGKSHLIAQLRAARPAGERWAWLSNSLGAMVPGEGAAGGAGGGAGDATPRPDEFFQVAGGCACCLAGPAFRTALVRLLRAGPWQRLHIEVDAAGHAPALVDQLRSPPFDEYLEVTQLLLTLAGTEPLPGRPSADVLSPVGRLGFATDFLLRTAPTEPAGPETTSGAASAVTPAALAVFAALLEAAPPWPRLERIAGRRLSRAESGLPPRLAGWRVFSALLPADAPEGIDILQQWPADKVALRRPFKDLLSGLAADSGVVGFQALMRTERAWYRWAFCRGRGSAGLFFVVGSQIAESETAWRFDNRLCVWLAPAARRQRVDARVRGLDLALRDRSGLFDPGVS